MARQGSGALGTAAGGEPDAKLPSTFLVERSLPAMSDRHRLALQHALEEASRRLTLAGSPVRYLGSTFVPARSRCYSIFEAASVDAVRAVNEAALVPYIAINEAIDSPVTARASRSRPASQRADPARNWR